MNILSTIQNYWTLHISSVLVFGQKLLVTAIIILCGWLLTRLSQKIITKIKADETLASLFSAIFKYGIIIICLIMILDVFHINTTGLIAILGTAGLAIGFALRDTLSNIAAGIILLVLKPFCKGDFIECGSVSGTVLKMGLFSTCLDTADGIYIFAPNSNFWGVPLRNFSRNERRRMDITVTISFYDSVDTAFGVLTEIINSDERFLKDPPPQVMVQTIGDTGIGVTLRAWVATEHYWRIYWEQMKNVKEKIQEAGLTIAVPKRDVIIRQGDSHNPYRNN